MSTSIATPTSSNDPIIIMRAVWSRAGRLPGCHCHACLQATNTAVRPSAVAPARRKVRASEVFTACYTAIMATAAVLDAGQKDKRRQALDRRIDEAKSDLAGLMETSSAQDLSRFVRSSSASVEPTWHARNQSKQKMLLSLCQPTWEDLLKEKRARENRKNHLRRRGISLSAGPRRQSVMDDEFLQDIQVAIATEECNRKLQQREPVNGVQFSRVHTMIEDLVERLLQEAYRVTKFEYPGVHLAPPSSIDSAAAAIRLLKSDGYPRYDHPALDGVDAVDSRYQLNAVIRTVLGVWDHPRRQQHVAKICYNLLVCPVAPGIHNYNTLIFGLTRLGEHDLAAVVVDSFLLRSHLKPTRATVLCLLHHYRLKGDVIGFYNLIRRLLGHDTRGIGLGRRMLDETHGNNSPAWVRTADVGIREGYINQRAFIGPQELTAMLAGLVDLGQLRDAAKVVVVLLQEQYEINIRIFSQLVKCITATVDYAAARLLFEGFVQNARETTSLLLHTDLRRPTRSRLRLLLQMCMARSEELRHPEAGVRPARDTDLFMTLLVVRDHLSSIGKCLRLVGWALSNPGSRSDRLDLALGQFERVARSERQHEEKAAIFERLLALDDLQERVYNLEQKSKALKRQFRYIAVSSALPELQQDTLFDDRVALDAYPSLEEQLARRSSLLEQSAICFNRSRILSRDLKHSLLDALPPQLRHSSDLWSPGMTVDHLPLDKLLSVWSAYVETFPVRATPEIAEAPRQRLKDLLGVGYFAPSLTGMVRSYMGTGLARTTTTTTS